MNAPLQLLIVSDRGPDLAGSPFGPFAGQRCGTLDDAARALQSKACDGLLVDAPRPEDLAALAAWPALSHAVLDSAVIACSREPGLGVVLQLLQQGVQDVLDVAAAADDAAAVGRAMRLAIERKRLEKSQRRAYATDLATGLPNHAQLLEHMTHLVALRAREPAPMALIVLRIQGLAATADALGAEAANVLKRKVAVRLRSGLRASDVVASLGTETFAVLLAWIDAADDGERVARKLASSLAQPFTVTGRVRSVAVSVGLASFPEHGDHADALLRRALGQAASVATVGAVGLASAADRGPSAAANDDG